MACRAPPRPFLRQLAAVIHEHPNPSTTSRQSRNICLSCNQRSSHSTSSQVRHVPITSIPKRSYSQSIPRYQETQQASTSTQSSDEITMPLNLENHYTLFPQTLPGGPPPRSSFTISTPQLRREFLQLQTRYHPDKFPSDQKLRAEALSSRINTAYKTLSDPLLRAQYLLAEFHGIDVLAEDQGSAQQDPDTLMEVMEAQEAIEEASEESEIEALKEENKQRIDDTVKILGAAIDSGNVEEARKECIKLRFWRSLQDGLHSWEPGKEVRLIH